jgi:hypothetical protein
MWQRGVAALGIALVYAQIGLTLAGAGSGPGGHGFPAVLSFVTHIGVALAMTISAFGLITSQDRRATALGFVHMAMAMLLLIFAWGFFPVALPAAPRDFRDLALPMVGLMFMTQALAKGTGFPKG